MSSRPAMRNGRAARGRLTALRAGAVILAVALGGAACGAEEAPSRTEPTTGGPATSQPSETPAVDEPLPCVSGAEPFTGPAADAYGADRVMAAYCMLAGLVEEQRSTTLGLPIPEQHPADLAGLAEVLGPRIRKDWDRLVRARAAGERSATERVNGLTLHDVAEVPRGYRRADDLPHVFGTRVGPATASLARGGEALRLAFTVETNLVLEKLGDDSGRHLLLPVTRRGAYLLVPGGDGWLVSDWDVRFQHGDVQLVTG